MKKSLILFFSLISVLINAQTTIVSNSFDNSSDWIIGTPNLQDYARGIYLLKVAYGDRVEEVKVIKD